MKLSRLRLVAFALFILLCRTSPCAALPANARAAAQGAVSRADDDAALRVLINDYFAAYAARDLKKFVGFWKEKSAGREARRAEAEKQFAAVRSFELKGVSVESLLIDGDAARARVGLELNGTDARAGQPAPTASRQERALGFAKESGAWRIARDVSAADEVAASLSTAKDEAARSAILAAETNIAPGDLLQPTIRIANRLFVEGDYERALAAYDLVRELAQRANNPRGLALALMGQGLVHYKRDEDDLALDAYARSLAATDAKDVTAVARAHINIGNVHYKRGDFTAALASYGRGLALQQSPGNDQSITQTLLNNIGSVYYEQRDLVQAREYFERSLRLAETPGDAATKASTPGKADTLNNLGDIAREGGDYAKALVYYQLSIDASEPIKYKLGIARTLNNIGGGVYLYQSDAAHALEYLRRSIKLYDSIGEKYGRAIASYNAGRAFSILGDGKQSLDYAAQAISLGRESGNLKAVAQAQNLTGDVLLAGGKNADARRAYDDAILTTEQMRADAVGGETERQRFFENKTAPYESMIRLLASGGDPAGAFAYAERAKARVLLDVLQGGRHDVTKSMTARERADEVLLRGEITRLNQQALKEGRQPQPDAARVAELKSKLDRARLSYEAFRTALYAAHPALRAQRGESSQLTAAQAAALLPDARSAALEFAVADDATYLFVVTRDARGKPALDVYPIAIKRADISARAEAFRQLLASRGLGFREAASQLYDLLLKPAARALEGKTSLIVVPDAGLWSLPFQALVATSGKYLVEDFAISYASSLSVLGGTGKLRRPDDGVRGGAQRLLAFGNPTDGDATGAGARGAARGTNLAPLPEAEREVRTLGNLYGAARSRVFTGAEATEARVKAEAPRYAVVHLASHGVLDAANPMYSRIVMAGGVGGEDGSLEAWELMQMDLRADLFVLSACETARGRVGAGEGLIGMSWALFVAGVPTVVVSNWKVSSSSTTELMLNFHRSLLAGGRRANTPFAKAGALRQASLALLKSSEYQHPFYWAGFSMFGDGR